MKNVTLTAWLVLALVYHLLFVGLPNPFSLSLYWSLIAGPALLVFAAIRLLTAIGFFLLVAVCGALVYGAMKIGLIGGKAGRGA